MRESKTTQHLCERFRISKKKKYSAFINKKNN